MFRKEIAGALCLAALTAGCGKDEGKAEVSPLVGVGGNPYCVTDQDEYRLEREAASDMMAAWILIHHYQMCELDQNRSATLLRLQLSKDQNEAMKALAEFNARIEAGRKALAEKAK